MAHMLRFEKGGNTLVFQGNAVVRWINYTPASPLVTTTEYVNNLSNGGEVTNATRRNVTESVEMLLEAENKYDLSDVQTFINNIETWIREAEEYQIRKAGNRVYVEFTPQDSIGIWRSEILSGRVDIDEIFPLWLSKGVIRITVYWKRRYYWEGDEVELPLENTNSPYAIGATGGIGVENVDDATYCNWVDIDKGDVPGVIPAPIRLEMTNTYATGRHSQMFIGHNVFANPSSFDHILQGQDATGGTLESLASCSGGEYRSFTWAVSTETKAFTWALSSVLMGNAAGNLFHVIARLPIILNTQIWVRLKIVFNLTTIWQSQQFQIDTNYSMALRSLGVIQLPPWLTSAHENISDLELQLFVQIAGGSITTVDFLQLTPTDSYRTLFPMGYGCPQNHRVVDDGIAGLVYTDSGSGTARYGYYIPRGRDIMLWPGYDQRLYFLVHSNSANSAEINRSTSVRVYYRPRRLAL